MKKKVFTISIISLVLVTLVVVPLVCRFAHFGHSFLPENAPVSVKIMYFDAQGKRQECEINESEKNTAITLYQMLEHVPRYHTDYTVVTESQHGSSLMWYDKFAKNSGALRLYFEDPISYCHADYCSCDDFAFDKAEYNHIDLVYFGVDLLVVFMLNHTIVADYKMTGSYLPAFREILAANMPTG